MESTKVLSQAELSELKVSDVVDARDCKGTWYVDTVLDVTPTSVHVTFTGWQEKFNEWLDFTDKKLAKRGTFTNGKLHTTATTEGEAKCECVKCSLQGSASGNGCGNPGCSGCGGGEGGDYANQLLQMLMMMGGGAGGPGSHGQPSTGARASPFLSRGSPF